MVMMNPSRFLMFKKRRVDNMDMSRCDTIPHFFLNELKITIANTGFYDKFHVFPFWWEDMASFIKKS